MPTPATAACKRVSVSSVRRVPRTGNALLRFTPSKRHQSAGAEAAVRQLCCNRSAGATGRPLRARYAGLAQTRRQTYPAVEQQGAYTYSFRVGDIRIAALSDGTVPADLHDLLRDTTNQKTDGLLKMGFVANPVEVSINVFMFKLGGRLFLVDTGSGDLFPAGFGGKLLQSLAAAGVRPEEVTDILLTHAHDDHMGGLVHNGALAFPNATVHVGKGHHPRRRGAIPGAGNHHHLRCGSQTSRPGTGGGFRHVHPRRHPYCHSASCVSRRGSYPGGRNRI